MLAIIARDEAPVAGTRNRATGRPWLPSRHRAARISRRGPGIPNGAKLVRVRGSPVVSVVPFTDDLSLGMQSGACTHATAHRRASRASQSSGIRSASIFADVSIIAHSILGILDRARSSWLFPGRDAAWNPFP